MVVSISIKDDIARATRRLNNIERKQIPFATSGAINDTLFDIRKQIVGVTGPKAFTTRNKRFLSVAMRVEKARKSKLTGAVFDRLGRASLGLHARGGTKRPKGGSLAIPSKFVRDKRGKSGKISKTLKPRTVLSREGSRKGFKRRLPSGQEAIFRRTTKRGPLQLLYYLAPRAPIDKTFRFAEDATKVAKRVMPGHFNKRLRRALRTAR